MTSFPVKTEELPDRCTTDAWERLTSEYDG